MNNPDETNERPRLALGLMSGTSLDGIDAAIITTDGEQIVEPGPFISVPYDGGLRDRMRNLLRPEPNQDDRASVAADITQAHAKAVDKLIEENGLTRSKIDIIGFHGHTIFHEPAASRTDQIGDGKLLAALTGCAVVNDFRSEDVAAGGQGAPLAPLYHRARSAGLARPLAVLNIGGVANVTWLGRGEDQILAFDTGPGCALIDDWVYAHDAGRFDRDGLIAKLGSIDHANLSDLSRSEYFGKKPPKSLDRSDFSRGSIDQLDFADGAATLTAFTVESIARASDHFAAPVERWLVTGGGRHNLAIMDGLCTRLGVPVDPVESVGWRGDALEAEAFGFLAVRSLRGLPLSLPSTTGCGAPITGGRLWRPPRGD